MINVCIPTLNATDDFYRCVESIKNSSVECNIHVLDNGRNLTHANLDIILMQPPSNLGVAGSWNWFIDNVDQYRIITNDDIIFDKYAIEKMMESYTGDFLTFPENLGSAFSCFLLPSKIIESVGVFDEWISPRYAYFEDNDYFYRMELQGFHTKRAEGSFVQHVGSSTLKHFDKDMAKTHHDKFRLAREHYKQKWGGEPGFEVYKTPFGR